MLCLGLIHGDLSEYNVLVAPDGPVIIDFPQVVSAAGNNAARAMLLRDVQQPARQPGALRAGAADTALRRGDVGAVRERRAAARHRADRPVRASTKRKADVDAVMMSIEDARQEAMIRQQGRGGGEGRGLTAC